MPQGNVNICNRGWQDQPWNAKLICGDCLEVMPNIPAQSVDLILCDPPYGTTSRNPWDKVIDLAQMWAQYKRILKPNGAILIFSQQPFAAKLIESNPKMFRYEWIWEKPNAVGFLNAKRMPLRAHENILVFYNSLPTYNPQKMSGNPYKPRTGEKSSKNYGEFTYNHNAGSTDGTRYPRDVIVFSRAQGYHPTQKPVPLLEYFIKTYTNEGELVLDNCMGSGSTGVAAVNTDRRFIGIELNEDYFNIAQERIESAKTGGQNGKLENG